MLKAMRMDIPRYVAKNLSGLQAAPVAPATSPVPLIGTHDGSFHCDEAMACGLLRHTAAMANANVVRTRLDEQLKQCNIVVDVGTVYNADSLRFDHHQKEFNGTMHTGAKQYNTRLSSAGLVYKHYGREIIRRYTDACAEDGALTEKLTEAQVDLLFDRVYKDFVEHIDGIDNGVEEYCGKTESDSVVRNYNVSTTLSSRVGKLYPRWNEENNREREDAAFVQAVTLATTEFFQAVDYLACSWLPARSVVQKAFDAAGEIHESKAIISFKEGGCPWKDHLVDLEKESDAHGRTLFVLFQDTKGGWRVMAVPKENASFQNRKSLPWRGLRDAELDAASGIDGCVFVHVGGFIGGNKTYEGAVAMATKALTME